MTTNPTHQPVRSIAYATPPAREPRRWFSLRTVLLALLIAGFVQINFLLQSPIKRIFMDFHLKLPGLTQLWIDTGNWWNASYGWVIAWPVAVALSIGITLLRRPPQHGNEKLKWLVFSNLALLAFNITIMLTCILAFQPMYTLLEGISGKH